MSGPSSTNRVVFYRKDVVNQQPSLSLKSMVPSQASVTDFQVSLRGHYLAATSTGQLLLGRKVNRVLEWDAVDAFTRACHRLAATEEHVFVLGSDVPTEASSPPFALAVFVYAKRRAGRRAKADGEIQPRLVLKQKIASHVLTPQALFTCMAVTGDAHYVVAGTTAGQVEVFRVNRSRSAWVQDISLRDQRVPVQAVYIIPSPAGSSEIRTALIVASAPVSTLHAAGARAGVGGAPPSQGDPSPTSPSSTAVPAQLALLAFTGTESRLHPLSAFFTPQPCRGPAVGLLSASTLVYYNAAPGMAIVEMVKLNLKSVTQFENVRDIAQVDTVLRVPHPLFSSRMADPLANLCCDPDAKVVLTVAEGGDVHVFNNGYTVYEAREAATSYLAAVHPANGGFALLCTNPAYYTVQELRLLDPQARINSLIGARMFKEALELVTDPASRFPPSKIADVRRRYADQLFDQGSIQDSVTHYVSTIGFVESSLIIQKFCVAEEADILIRYLEELHMQNQASDAHTNLLIHSYHATGGGAALNRFVERCARLRAAAPRDAKSLKLDVAATVSACLLCDFVETGLKTAVLFGREDLALDILVAEGRLAEALGLLCVLGFDACLKCVQRHGAALMAAYPERCAALLKALCFDYVPASYSTLRDIQVAAKGAKDAAEGAAGAPPAAKDIPWVQSLLAKGEARSTGSRAVPCDVFLNAFLDHTTDAYLLDILRFVLVKNLAEFSRYDEGIATATATAAMAAAAATAAGEGAPALASPPAPPPSARPQQRMGADALHTFFELLLAARARPEDDALLLTYLKSVTKYGFALDQNHLLLRFHVHKFEDGIVFLYKQRREYVPMIRYWLSTRDYYNTLELYSLICDDPASSALDRSIWTEILVACAQDGNREGVAQVLERVKDDDSVSPLQILSLLTGLPGGDAGGDSSSSGSGSPATVGLVRGYYTHKLRQLTARINRNASVALAAKQAIEQTTRATDALAQQALYVKAACALCGVRVDPPFVYFRCGHAFHKRCLQGGGDAAVCAVCFPTEVGLSREERETMARERFYTGAGSRTTGAAGADFAELVAGVSVPDLEAVFR